LEVHETDAIDLNCDMGESVGAWTMGSDAEILKIVSSAIPVTIDSVCVHGDNTAAVAMARRVRDKLEQAGSRSGR
jgi:lactam utilization protein B